LVLPQKGIFALFVAATAGLGLFGGAPLLLVKDYLDLLSGKAPKDGLGLYVRNFLENFFGPSNGEPYLYGLCATVLLCWLLKGFFTFLTSYLSAWLAQSLRMEAMVLIMRKLLTLDESFFDRSKIGDLVSRMVSDGNALRMSVKVFLDFIQQPPMLLAAACYAMYLSPTLFLMGALGLPIVILPLAALTRRIYHHGRNYQQQTADVTELMLQNLSGIRIVHAYGAEKAEGEAFGLSALKLFHIGMKRNMARAMQRPLAELLMGLGLTTVIFYGGLKVTRGEMGASDFITFVLAASSLYGPLKAMMGALGELAEMVPAAERTFEVLDRRPKIEDKPAAIACPPLKKTVVFENVTFDYGRGPVFRDLNLTVRQGEMVGIVGRTGIGKSTLLSLLLRFYDPADGRILMDGTDLRDIQLASLRAGIGLVTQDPFLFNASVADNIRYGRPEASDEEIVKAAQAAAIHAEIAALPDGYSTRVGERGGTFSGGQRQRIAVARAILRNAPLLLLDEPTSALDAESERLVQDALDRLSENRTTLIVTHRLQTLKRANRVVVFADAGGIEAAGSHEALLATSPTYARLWQERHETPKNGLTS
jgi:ABC-type multidrug transport system fused ATPase/permease subunit